jgi:exosome complex component RRP42
VAVATVADAPAQAVHEMENNQVSILKQDFIKALLADGKREDGRPFDGLRPLTIETDYVADKAQGSAFVRLGKTKVLAGVKCQTETPYNDTPARGNFMTSCEMTPMASPFFEAGPPRVEAIEVARVTDRNLRESGVIDMEALCIEAGVTVWGVFVDLHILDYDGNLFDACSIAALAAVLDAVLPAVCPKTGRKVYDKPRPLPLKPENATFSTTFVKIDGHVLVDPGLYEELIADARITIGVDPTGAVRAMQKGGFGSWTVDEVKQLRKQSAKLGQDVYKAVKASLRKK